MTMKHDRERQAPLESEMAALFAAKTKFLILDTETTGLLKDPDAQVIEVSCIYQDGKIAFSSLVKPDRPVPEAASKIHGLTDADLVDAPTFAEFWPFFIRVLNLYPTIYCYNQAFDFGMIQKTAQYYHLPLPKILKQQRHWRCMMLKYAEYHGESGLYGDYKWQSLSKACAQMYVPMSEAHRATGDCLSTLALMKALAAKHNPGVQESAPPDEAFLDTDEYGDHPF